MTLDRHQFAASVAVLPGNPPEPCPEVLTAEEAVRYLRLDVGGPKNPEDTLRSYREKGLLVGIQVGRHLRYRRKDLDAFLERLANNKEAESC